MYNGCHRMTEKDQKTLEGCAQWMLEEVAERRDSEGNFPKRGRRRQENGERIPLASAHRSYCGDDIHVGNDFSWRVAVAVEALMRAGHSECNACVEVAEHPTVVERLEEDDLTKRVENVRSKHNYQRKKLGLRLDKDLANCLADYREKCCRDEEWYEVQLEAQRLRRLDGNRVAAAQEGILLHELAAEDSESAERCRRYRTAREAYERARVMWEHLEPRQRIKTLVLDWIDRQIANCESLIEPDPIPSVRADCNEGDGEVSLRNLLTPRGPANRCKRAA